jgi:hypothetical protein
VRISASAHQLALTAQPGTKEGIALGGQPHGNSIRIVITGAVLQEREHRAWRCRAVPGFQPGPESIAEGLGSVLKGLGSGFVLGDHHQFSKKLGNPVLIKFGREVGTMYWHRGLSMPDFRAEVDRLGCLDE